MRKIQQIGPVDYGKKKTPPGCVCCKCGAKNCQLERPHLKTVPEGEDVPLYCADCVPKFVPAILVPNGEAFYQDGAAPRDATRWYKRLRKKPKKS